MNWLAILQRLLAPSIGSGASHPSASSAEKLEQFKQVGRALLSQLGLLRRLAYVEWAEEKARWRGVVIAGLAIFALMICALLFIGVFAMVLSWETPYRYWIPLFMVVLYAAGGVLAWTTLKRLVNKGEQAFASTRKELLADISLVKENLWP